MSAAGRGPRLGGPEDFYATPSACVDRLLEAVELPGGLWVEPSAGDGAIVRAVSSRRADVDWATIEIRPDAAEPLEEALPALSRRPLIADFLTYQFVGGDAVKVCVGNPPYNSALEFINRALALFPNAHVVFLLRLNFAASRARAALMHRAPPDAYVLPNRPSFRNGKTDATEYAWFVWPPNCSGRTAGVFKVLALNEQATARTVESPQKGLFE